MKEALANWQDLNEDTEMDVNFKYLTIWSTTGKLDVLQHFAGSWCIGQSSMEHRGTGKLKTHLFTHVAKITLP